MWTVCSKISFVSKSFVVILFLLVSFLWLLFSFQEFSKSFLATAIMSVTPVSCYWMTSFNYGGKEATDAGLTCRCHLSNIMPDIIFYDRMEWEITSFLLFFFFCKRVNDCLPQNQRDRFSCLIIITPMDLENLKLYWTKADGIN